MGGYSQIIGGIYSPGFGSLDLYPILILFQSFLYVSVQVILASHRMPVNETSFRKQKNTLLIKMRCQCGGDGKGVVCTTTLIASFEFNPYPGHADASLNKTLCDMIKAWWL